jgi:RNA-binding protein
MAGMSVLTPRQRQYLKGLAHPLSPTVRIGKSGPTPAVVKEARTALHAHELIKVRAEIEDRDERRQALESLAGDTGAALVGRVGKVAILYRAREEDPSIELPR